MWLICVVVPTLTLSGILSVVGTHQQPHLVFFFLSSCFCWWSVGSRTPAPTIPSVRRQEAGLFGGLGALAIVLSSVELGLGGPPIPSSLSGQWNWWVMVGTHHSQWNFVLARIPTVAVEFMGSSPHLTHQL